MTHRLFALLLSSVAGAAPQATPPQSPAPKATPRPAPAPPLAIEGVVENADGTPVEKALVIARSAQSGFGEAPLSTRTDARGTFRFTLKDAGPYTLRAEAAGLAGTTRERVRPGSPLTVTLAPGLSVQGTVRDGGTALPVPGALVEARDNKAVSLPWQPEAGSRSAKTDDQGRYRIDGLGNGLHSVSASVRGSALARRTDVRPGGAAVDLYLFAGGSVSGVVRGADAEPLAGAVVQAEPETPVFGGTPPRPDTSRADGRFEIAGLPAGAYRLVARHHDFAPAVSAPIPIEKGADAREDLVLEQGGQLTGRLVDPEGRPIAAGRVLVTELNGQAAPRALADLLRADSGGDGSFRLASLPPGDHMLSISAFGYSAKPVDARVEAGGARADVGDVVLETGLAIRGRVRDRAGAPVAGAQLSGFQARVAAPGTQFPAEGRSEADGSFVLGGLAPGTYRVTVRAGGYGEMTRQLDAGTEKVEVVLAPAGSVTGQVVDEAGRAVEVFRVEARAVATGPSGPTGAPRSQDVASPDGRFSLEEVPEGTHVLSVSAPERAGATVSDVKVAGGSATDVGRVRLDAGGTIRGQVVDTAGAGIPGTAVGVRGPGRDVYRAPFAPQALSDAGGMFEIRGAPTGLVEVTATHPNYATGRVGGIEVDPAKGPAEARVVLGQGGRVVGVARRRDGRGLRASVAIVPVRREGVGMLTMPSLIATDDDGHYLAEHVPSGRTNVSLMAGSGGSYVTAQNREVEVADGETVQVDFVSQEILVSGRVTRSGAPAAGMRVSLRPEQTFTLAVSFAGPPPAGAAGPPRGSALTREDGSYELIVGSPGKAFVTVQSADGRSTLPGRTAVIPDADAYSLDLDFGGVTVAGVVVDALTEAPLPQADVSAAHEKPTQATGAARAVSGPDGRFQLDLEPGAYRLSARIADRDYAPANVAVDIGEGGAPEVRLAMQRGAAISGRVLDAGGRGVLGLNVTATAGEPPLVSVASATTQADGSFRLSGLREEPQSVAAGSELGGFAVRTGVTPGEGELLLSLRPGGRLRVLVVGPDESPVAGAYVSVSRYRGAPVTLQGNATDAAGSVELLAPAGPLEIRGRKDGLEGRLGAAVGEGGLAQLTLRLSQQIER